MIDLKACIRDVPDFPKEGILFKDITPLLADKAAFAQAIDAFAERYAGKIDVIAGIESRGFIFGAALASKLGIGFVPVRKPGKLPADTYSAEYSLEYGTDAVEIHQDAISAGSRVLLIDDLLATGGTAAATLELLGKFDAEVVEVAFLIELEFLNGREKLKDHPVYAMISF